jgi:Domain of unknown function (DUF4191)
MSNPTPEPPKGRIRQMRQAYKITKRTDKNIGLILLLWFLLVGGAIAVAGLFFVGTGTFGIITSVLFALLSGLLALLIVFGRRAERSAYAQVEGQAGAAAGALQMLKRGWNVKPAIAFTKNQDVVHRVLGMPGIVLVGEGNPHRLRQLMTSERRKHERVAAEVPIHEVICGREEGQVPLPKLARRIQKLGRQVKPAEMTDILNRLKALDAQRSAIPLPKGPIPTNMKGMRGNMRGR